MRGRHRNRIRVLIGASTFVLALLLLWGSVQNWRLRRQRLLLDYARDYRHQVDARRLEAGIVQQTELIMREIGTEQDKRSAPGFTLVLVADDGSPACAAVLPFWELLLTKLPDKPPIEVWLVGFHAVDGGDWTRLLGNTLRKAGKPFRVLSVREPKLFAVATGIIGIPLASLHSGDAVRLVAAGQLPLDAYLKLEDTLAAPPGTTRQTVFIEGNQHDSIREMTPASRSGRKDD